MFSITHDLYPLLVSNTSPQIVTTKTSPDLAKSPQVQKYRPRVEQLVEITGGEKVKN
jgi:hypothetical protein